MTDRVIDLSDRPARHPNADVRTAAKCISEAIPGKP